MYQETAAIIASRIQDASHLFKTEEDVRLRCESIFIDELNKINIDYNPSYEAQVSSGAIDALFNQLCIEYKKPGELKRRFDFHVSDKAKYIPGLSEKYSVSEDQIACVIIDGYEIGFFRKNFEGTLIIDGPYMINEKSILRFITIAHSTQTKALISENLLNDFGYNSNTMKQLTLALWNTLLSQHDSRTVMFFKEWRRLFGQVSGVSGGSNAIKNEAKNIGININDEDFAKYVFVLQTTYAIYIKHIALMILQSKQYGIYKLYREHSETSLHEISSTIEDGSLFTNLGISNYMEGDFFCWYVLEWNQEIEYAIQSIINILGKYEPSTASLKSETVKDLLKDLYQGLLSKSIRHSLGEYYTPDWLAELTIKQSGYRVGDKVLDPSCGSGTFLVLLIKQIIEQLKKTHSPDEIAAHIQKSVYGFDLNPLAVITARTNYLIAIEPYWDATSAIEIPVYLTDAIFSPKQDSDYYRYHIDTEDGRIELCIPGSILKKGLLAEMLNKIESLVHLSTDSGAKAIQRETAEKSLYQWLSGHVNNEDAEIIIKLFREIYLLAEKNWDGIWCRIIKNHFASAVLKDFDVIVGNPPWLKWSALPTAYRTTIKDFCIKYGLFSSDKFYGGIESDVSTMVLYSAAEKWLRSGGKLAMLITRSIFKTESSEGFRKFRLPDNGQIYFKVTSVHDFTKIRPFDDAVNKPTLLTLEKGMEPTTYPLPWLEWSKTSGKRIISNEKLEKVRKKTSVTELAAFPVSGIVSPWLTIPQEDIVGCRALTITESEKKHYHARKGICTDNNAVFFGSVNGKRGGNVIFINDPGLGRDKSVKSVNVSIEEELVYPIARGREVACFRWNFSGTYGIVPQNSMHGFPEDMMLNKYPKALQYFANNKQSLLKRSSLKRYLPNDPFYACWNVGKYTFSPYKVCWAEISRGFQTCIISEMDGKCVIPDHKIYFIPIEEEEEAKYLCAYLNAAIVEELILGYVESTQIGTHITDYVTIPPFSSRSAYHIELAQITTKVNNDQMSVYDARKRASSIVVHLLNNE